MTDVRADSWAMLRSPPPNVFVGRVYVISTRAVDARVRVPLDDWPFPREFNVPRCWLKPAPAPRFRSPQ